MKKKIPLLLISLTIFLAISILVLFDNQIDKLPDEVANTIDKGTYFNKNIILKFKSAEDMGSVVSVDIWVFNSTSTKLWFPDNYDIQLFGKYDSEWKEIVDQNKYQLPQPGIGIFVQPYNEPLNATLLNFSISSKDFYSAKSMIIIITGKPVILGNLIDIKEGTFLKLTE